MNIQGIYMLYTLFSTIVIDMYDVRKGCKNCPIKTPNAVNIRFIVEVCKKCHMIYQCMSGGKWQSLFSYSTIPVHENCYRKTS